MAFLLKALGFPTSIPNFPFTVRDGGKPAWLVPLCPVRPTLGEWRVFHGTRNEDSKPVMVFSFNLSDRQASETGRELARNALYWAKVLLLPKMLRCYGGTEHEGTIYIATEPCEPLSAVLASEERVRYYYDEAEAFYKEAVILGLQDVAQALVHLSMKTLLHGHVGCSAVYVIASGEWRLFGLELVTGLSTTPSPIPSAPLPSSPSSVPASSSSPCKPLSWYLSRAPYVLLPYQAAPELGQIGPSRDNGHTLVFANGARYTPKNGGRLDEWGCACLLYEVFVAYAPLRNRNNNGSTNNAMRATPELLLQQLNPLELSSCRQIPYGMQATFSKLAATSPDRRPTSRELAASDDKLISSDLVTCVNALRAYTPLTSNSTTQPDLFDRLAQHVKQFPLRMCLCLLVPLLLDTTKLAPNASVVTPIAAIAERVQSEEDFNTHLGPAIVRLYACSDTLLRYRLLQRVESYAGKMSKASVVKMWADFMKGFASRDGTVREYSARAVIHLAARLEGNVVMSDVVPALTRLQQDADGALRSNATVSLCLLGPVLPSGPRGGVLLSGFTRMLKDPFAPSRLVALRSLRSSLTYFTPSQIATALLPAVSPMTMDKVGEIRELALHLIRAVLPTLDEYHATQTKEQQQQESSVTSEQRNASDSTTRSSSGAAKGKEATLRGSYNPLTSTSETEKSAEQSKTSVSLSSLRHDMSPQPFILPQRTASDARANGMGGQYVSNTSNGSNGAIWGNVGTLSRLPVSAVDKGWASSNQEERRQSSTDAARPPAVEDGWDDFDDVTPHTGKEEDEEDDGWGEAIDVESGSHTNTTTATTPANKTQTVSHVDVNGLGLGAASGRTSAAPERKAMWTMPSETNTSTIISSTAVSGQGAMSPPVASVSSPVGGAPMVLKPRKKGGGLGAARLS